MKLVILGRDGVLNAGIEPPLTAPEQWQPLPGALAAVARLHHEGFRIVLVANHPQEDEGGVERLTRLHARMLESIRLQGGEIDAIFVCPHSPAAQCRCRLPQPGLLEQVAERLKVNPAYTVVAAGSRLEAEAARAAGATAALVGEAAASVQDPEFANAPRFAQLGAFAEALIADQIKGH